MEGLRSIVALPAESLRGIEPADIGRKLPKFEWVDPRSLFIEEAYQRNFSSSSTKLIREIVVGWNWANFKTPICVRLPESGNILVVIDGQHTATAAACHSGIPKIPVMIVPAEEVASRAEAFVEHNTHRIALTQLAIFTAQISAENPIAAKVQRACRRAGVIIPRSQPSSKDYKPGMTLAIGTLRAIAREADEAALARVLSIVAKAGRAPIRAAEIAAVALFTAAFPDVDDAKLTAVIARHGAQEWVMKARADGDAGAALPSNLAAAWARALSMRAGDIRVVKGERSPAQFVGRRRPVPAPAPGPAAKAPASQPAPAAKPPPARPAEPVVQKAVPAPAPAPRASEPTTPVAAYVAPPPYRAPPKAAAPLTPRRRATPAESARMAEEMLADDRRRFSGLGQREYSPHSFEDKQQTRDILRDAAANTAKLPRPRE